MQTSCGTVGNLSVDGSVTMSYEDLDSEHFSPVIYIKTPSTDICTIDISNCAFEGLVNRSIKPLGASTVSNLGQGQDTCFCSQLNEKEFRLFVRKAVPASLKGTMLHAELHHQNATNPTIVYANIGVVAAGSQGSSSTPRQLVTMATTGTQAVCDTVTDGGGWVIFQRRASAQVSFFQDWANYAHGFGNLNVDGNFWWGLTNVHNLCRQSCELRIDMKFSGKDYHATYQHFRLDSEADLFRMHVSGYSGTAGDVLGLSGSGTANGGNNLPFTTKDKDHDNYSGNCATLYHGGWWFNSCHAGDLNGLWGDSRYGQGLNWMPLTTLYKSVTFSEMKVRPNPVTASSSVVIGK